MTDGQRIQLLSEHLVSIFDIIKRGTEKLGDDAKIEDLVSDFDFEREKEMIDWIESAQEAAEGLVGNTVFADSWNPQVWLYAYFNEAVNLRWGDTIEKRGSLSDWGDCFHSAKIHLSKFLDALPGREGDPYDKYVCALHVTSEYLAQLSPAMYKEGRYAAGLTNYVNCIGPLADYITWLELLGHDALARRLESSWHKVMEAASLQDRRGQRLGDSTNADRARLETRVMALADVTASIVRLLATPDDGKCSYPTRGTSPLMQDTFPGIAQTISSKQPPAETLSGTRQGEDANDTGVSDMRKAEEQSTRHSEDFTSVVWFGEQYQFNKGLQAASVKCLWKAWKNGTPSLSQETIGERSGSAASNFRLAHVFRNLGKTHPAWGKMIVSAGKGMFKLAEPETECPTE